MKLYVEGFRGPWGWTNEFEEFTSIPLTNEDDADVILNCNHGVWRKNVRHLGKKFVIANVLDFAEWVGGNAEIDEYVDKFCRHADVVTANPGPLAKLNNMGIPAKLLHDPSQISDKIINNVKPAGRRKQKKVISFCRLGDPGKKIEESLDCFMASDLPSLGWKYDLVGPEPTRFDLAKYGKVVRYHGYLPAETLYTFVAMAGATLMPSLGEGLGLPAIESILVGTIPVCRRVEPMISLLGDNSLFFSTPEEYIEVLNGLGAGEYDIDFDEEKFEGWKRNIAFELLEKMIIEEYNK